MRVLFIAPLPEPITGQALASQIFLDELAKDHEVEVINMNKSEYTQGVSSVSRIVEVIGFAFRAWLKRLSADVIYYTPSESFAGSVKDLLIYLVCFRQLPRMVLHLNGGAGMREILLRPHPLRRLNEFFLRRVGGAIVLGERLADIYRNVLPRERIHLIANCAEDHLFVDPVAIDRKFDGTRPLRLLFLSNLIPGKGHLELIDAFFTLDEATRDAIQIDLAGGFESDEQKRAVLRRIDGVPQIHYHGTVRGERRRKLFQEAHLFCLPTYYAYEGQPLSILEAYAAGCAVITTDHSGIFDTFVPNVNGLAVDKRSSSDLVAAIRRAVSSPETLHTMAQTNLRTAELHYRASSYTANMMRVVHSLVAMESVIGT
jgi:glycosyltransferase involved in cell wall biosynthesis